MNLKVGITGGIGSGKTTVCRVFELLGIPVFYADEVAKKLMVEEAVLVQKIRTEFGAEAYFKDHSLNKKHLSNLVFKQPTKLEKLNSFVHPLVFAAFADWSNKQQSPYVLKEAALLFESGSYLKNEANILVSCPLELRVKRVMQRDQITREKVLDRIATQFSEDKKETLANYIIQNNEKEFIIRQVLNIHQLLIKKAAE